jgi:signal peptidase
MRGVAGWVGQVIAWAVILFAVALIALAVAIPRLGGATPYTILTGSMQPHYPPGTLVVAKPVDPDRLKVGDVVTYQLHSGEPEVVTHRIVAVGRTLGGQLSFQTQGDANNAADDPWVMPIQIRGRLWYAVPYLGRLNVLFDGRQHQWLVYTAAAGLGGYAVVMFLGAARDRTRSRAAKRKEGTTCGRHA